MAKLIWAPIKVRLGEIRAWQDNPRLSTKAQALRIIDSEKKFGQPIPFLLMPMDGNKYPLIDGHQRLAAWLTVYGDDYAMDAMVSDRALTDAEHKEMIITLHTGATGSWDWNALSGWDVGELQEWGFDKSALDNWNNDANNLKEMLTAEVETVDAEPQIDRAEELLEKWQVKTGDLWRIGEHTLFVGSYENFDLRGETLVYDPPWDKRFVFDFSAFDNILAFSDGQRVGDIIGLLGAPAWEFVWDTGACWYTPNRPLKKHKNCYWYGDIKKYNPEGYFFEDDAKQHTVKNTRGEYVYVPDPRGKRLLDVYAENITKTHADGASHSKPAEWMSALLANCTSGDVVDPFCGTGTSIIAAHNIGRRCFASEINEKMCAVILQRCEDIGLFPERSRTNTVQIACAS